jgi:hypothetical protein
MNFKQFKRPLSNFRCRRGDGMLDSVYFTTRSVESVQAVTICFRAGQQSQVISIAGGQ